MFKRECINGTDKDWKEVEELNEWLNELKSLKVNEVRVEGSLAKSKIAWSIMSLSQAYVHRLVELGEACADTWNNKQYIASLTLARSIIETGAMLCDLDDRVKINLDKRNLDALNEYIMKKSFSTRIKEWLEKSKMYKASSILTLIQKRNRELPGLMDVYDHLSEYVHPNRLGHLQHYGDLDHSDGTVRFQKHDKSLNSNFHSVFCAFSFIEFGVHAYNSLQDNIEKVAELQHEINPVSTSSAS